MIEQCWGVPRWRYFDDENCPENAAIHAWYVKRAARINAKKVTASPPPEPEAKS